MDEISLTIDGKPVRCRHGTSLLEAAREAGIPIPTLCHHPDLKPAGACRICLVEDAKSHRILASCVTPAAPDMKILTDSPDVLHHRANVIRLMMANHPESCILCDQGNRCRLRDIAAELGIGRIDLYPMPRSLPYEDANPFIVRDLTKCILCGRCIRADRELVVVGAIDYQQRGFDALPATLHREPLERSSCTFCGTCVTLCPTGALRARNAGYAGSPETWSPSVCGFCGVGCAMNLGSSAGRLVEVEPEGGRQTVNHATLCVRGHFEQDFLDAEDRILAPRAARDGESVQVAWSEALQAAAHGLRSVASEFGPQSVAFLGSADCSVEEGYLLQKISRAVLGTGNVLLGAEENPLAERLTGLDACELRRLEEAEAVLVAGADLTDTHPVLGYAVKRAARWKGVPLVVLNPLRTDLAAFADAWIPTVPGEEGEVLDALSAALLDLEGCDPVIAEGFESYSHALSRLDREAICRRHGTTPGVLERAAKRLLGRRIVFVVSERILAPPWGEQALRSLENFALLTGSLGEGPGGLLFPASECNRVGALDMGVSRDMLPGRMPLEQEAGRRHWERAWGVRLSPDPGLPARRLIQEAEQGNLKALYVMGANPLRSFPQPERVGQALRRLDLLVVQDILETETAALAHVVLPGAASAEKAGTFTNLEGRVQSFEPVLPPPGDARPDWRILCDLYDALSGGSDRYGALEDLRREIRDHVPGYGRLALKTGGNGRPWFRRFPAGAKGRAATYAPPDRVSAKRGEDPFPLWALFETPRCHMGSGTRTSRSQRAAALEPHAGLEMSGGDAERLGLSSGDRVRITSAAGSLEREVEVVRRMPEGLVRVAAGIRGNEALRLLSLSGGEAARRACRVRVEKV